MRASLTLRHALLLVMTTSGLAACGADMDELDAYIAEIKRRPGGEIAPLPDPNIYEAFEYIADVDGIRSPFRPDTPQRVGANNDTRPDLDRSREYLESFPLDTLGMVGTMFIEETMFGLLQTSDGLIHRVVPGNYIGQNDGRITGISESAIEVVEIISDGIGGYIERDAAVGLTD